MKKKCIKNLIALTMTLIMTILTADTLLVSAHPKNIDNKHERTNTSMLPNEENSEIDMIMNDFVETFSKISLTRSVSNSLDNKEEAFISQYGNKLVSLGYEPHIVHSENYDECMEELNTDFTSMGLDANGTYLILIEAVKDQQSNARASTSYSYGYNYNGTRYKMRKFTVKAADDPNFYKASYCNLLDTTSNTLIKNCLSTAISTYISSVSSVLGTVASISGLNSAMFNKAGQCTLIMHAATTWTRVYTQVYLTDRSEWVNGSCIEYVTAESCISGMYYNSSTNSSTYIEKNWKSEKLYSPRYYDDAWRNEMAVIYATNRAGIRYDLTGDVKYKYGGKVKITHYENF